MLKSEIKLFIKFFIFLKISVRPFFVVPRAAVGDFGCLAHGSNFVALTATLEVKLSSRTLVDIMEAKILLICSSYFAPHFFFSMDFCSNPNCHKNPPRKKK